MYGSVEGNIIGTLYFLAYQVIGIYFAGRFFKKEEKMLQLLLGSVTGTVALHWFPTIVSFFMDFTISSHIVGLILFALLIMVISTAGLKKKVFGSVEVPTRGVKGSFQMLWKEISTSPVYWIIALLFLVFVGLLSSHSIPMVDGAVYTGQCGYGDMNMHLGFITSIARQGTFPPEYSILPGVELAYPFLCDSVSSSIYLFGTSLRWAYMLPMMLAVLQVFVGFAYFTKLVLGCRVKTMFAFLMFFVNGGFGFAYFVDKVQNNKENFNRIFTAFYETPTNYVGSNVRWSNVIADMLLPQRATLFGWAILFGTLALLYQAAKTKNMRYFVMAGIFGGALPMIHTHSFLGLALVCSIWVVGYMYKLVGGELEGENTVAKYVIPIGLLCMCLLQRNTTFLENIPKTGLVVAGFIVASLVALVLYYVWKVVEHGKWQELFKTWGVFLILVLCLALPQLFRWTFQQAQGESFLRGWFNWANEEDQYIWFYIKNIGITAVLAVPAFIYAKKRKFFIVAPTLLIWAIAEFVVFQPNVYDNNKLLYVGYSLICILVADFTVDLLKIFHKYKKVGSYVCGACILFVGTFSGILTIGREWKSGEEYELYNRNQMELCEFIEDNLPEDAVVLTNDRHNNAVASLTGRNIVCGTGTFLYYHGVSYQDRLPEIQAVYEAPLSNTDILEKYKVSYILVGPEERGSYNVDEVAIQSMATCIFSENDVQLYQIDME
ncbi:MAG: hypothetical protein II992_04810 [Lachnospiraceae bacterium]|nr:hypothetical protein [Lachnospiraceae bacterium]